MADEAETTEDPTPALTAGEGGPSNSEMDFVLDVPLRVTVEIGGARMLIREVLQLGRGSVVELDRANGEPADILVNGRVVARGEVTTVDDRVAIKVVDVVGKEPTRAGE